MKPYQNPPYAPLPMTDYNNARQVDASTAENIAVPSGAVAVRLTSLTSFYAKPDATAAAASGDVTDGTASILVPANVSREFAVQGVTNISVLSSSGTILVYAEFFSAR